MRLPLSTVRAIAVRGRQPANSIALALLQGDADAESPLRDCLFEQGESMTNGLEIGKNYYIETVTKYYCGELLAIDYSGLTLINASWIPDTGRIHESFRTGQFNEVEPLPDNRKLFLPAGVISAVVEWSHKLPREAR